MTPEVQLWLRLRNMADGFPRFRRQHAIGPYMLDFYCPAARLAAEVDGWGHNMEDQPERDEARDAWLAERRITVQRIPASDVLANPDDAADGLVRQAVGAVTPPPSASPPPPPLRRGGEGATADSNAEDPFAVFDEWASDADVKAFALFVRR